MEQLVRLAVFAAVLLSHPGWVSTQTNCPWDEPGLLLWSEASTWDDGAVPADDGKVVIKSGKHVLLDVQPATLATLTIEANASLVWGNISNLELQSEYILVDGAFHMGSRSCRFKQPASIKLKGTSKSLHDLRMSDGETIRKVVLVREGGTLELHGEKKTSWTRLAQTIPALSDLPCPFIYDHSDHEANPFAAERGKGLHVIAWHANGSVFDFSVFQKFTSLKGFVQSIPDGKVVGMFAFGSAGLDKRTNTKNDFDTLDDVIMNDLGGKLISSVTKWDSYSLLTLKGSKTSTLEHYKYRGRIVADEEEDFLQLPIWGTQRAFQVATSARTTFQYFRVLSTDVAYPILELAEDVRGWSTGDKIVVASTDFDWRQAEVREIVDCQQECSASQIRVHKSFRYRHYGNFTYNVDERAEVGLLSRNIVIEGVMQTECTGNNKKEKIVCKRFGQDTFGGHVRVLRGHKSVHVQGVELFHMGQQAVLGSYPLHFHMCDSAPGSWFKDNSIHHSFQRCITVHGTDDIEVSGNVCYDHLGHGYFLEDSVEQNNVINGNLGLGTRHGMTLMSDSLREWCAVDFSKELSDSCGEVSTFWVTHPNNELSNNAAAGGEGHGFMYVFADLPLGPSYERQQQLGKVGYLSARSTPIKKFYNNVAHSYRKSGLFFDSHISTGRLESDSKIPQNGIVQEQNFYEPRDPPGDPNGRHVWTTIDRFTAYRNRQNNIWLKGGDINVTYCSLADAASQSFSGGNTGFWTGVSIEYCIFIGRSDNTGQPRTYTEKLDKKTSLTMTFPGTYGPSPWHTVTGVGIYQGPMFVKHTYFDRFNTLYWNDAWTEKLGKRPVSNAGAISFKRDSTYPTYVSQYTTNLTFGYCDNVDNSHYVFFGDPTVYDWDDDDGTKAAHNWDLDGSLTGTPNTYIVRNRPFFTGPECLHRPDWHMSVCPYRYIKVEILGNGGSLGIGKKDQWPLVAYRDDAPQDPYYHKGDRRREFLTRTYTSFLVDFNTTMKGGAAFSPKITIFGYGVERQDVVRMGICMPKGMTDFEVFSNYPVVIRTKNYTRANSLAELDADTENNAIYHDTENGILFFKVWSRHDRTNDSQLCPAGLCYELTITLPRSVDLKKIRTCFGAKYPHFQDPRPAPAKVEPKPCPGIGSPEGLGAVRWDEVQKIVHEDFSQPPCVVSNPPSGGLCQEKIGCIVESTQQFGLPVTLSKTMTVDWCMHRCIQRQYAYAGLSKATCMCAHTLANTTDAWAVGKRTCVKTCPGNGLQTCGHTGRLDVWKTGLVSESSGLVLTTELAWLNVFDADLSPERYWRGTRIPKSGKEGDYT